MARLKVTPVHVQIRNQERSSTCPIWAMCGQGFERRKPWANEGAFTVLNATIKRIYLDRRWQNGEWLTDVPVIVMQPDEEAKFAELPFGWMWIDVDDCRAITVDFDALDELIVQGLNEHMVAWTYAQRDAIFHDLWSTYHSEIIERIEITFDIQNPRDHEVQFDNIGWSLEIALMDSGWSQSETRDVHDFGRLMEGGIASVYREWCRTTDAEYIDAMDDNVSGPALTRARKAFGATRKADLAKAHVPSGRRIVLEADERVPFPAECRYTGLTGEAKPLLVFNVTPDGRYSKPQDDQFYRKDCVFIHREGGLTRFIFWEHAAEQIKLAQIIRYVIILPISVADNECSRTAPLSPMRGMDPRVTRAVAGNPYFASAFQHALHRRAYLRTQIEARPFDQKWNMPAHPVLFRSGEGGHLKPDRYSTTGRRVVRANGHMADVTTRTLLDPMGDNDFVFLPAVQPVAPEFAEQEVKGGRRALQLDM